VRVLGQGDVEARAHLEKEGHPTDSEIRSETINSVKGRRRPRFSRKRRCQKRRRNQLKGGAGPPINPPLWVKLNFKLEEVPALVDTGAQFSCIRRDVVRTLVDLGVKAKLDSCMLECHLANGMHCDVRETVQLHFFTGRLFVEFPVQNT